ncbi:unnamed protein product, partial [Effrenium voratum]
AIWRDGLMEVGSGLRFASPKGHLQVPLLHPASVMAHDGWWNRSWKPDDASGNEKEKPYRSASYALSQLKKKHTKALNAWSEEVRVLHNKLNDYGAANTTFKNQETVHLNVIAELQAKQQEHEGEVRNLQATNREQADKIKRYSESLTVQKKHNSVSVATLMLKMKDLCEQLDESKDKIALLKK